VTGWRDRLARLRGATVAAETATCTAGLPHRAPFAGSGGFGGAGRDTGEDLGLAAARLLRLAKMGAAALAAADPDLAAERATIAATRAAEAAGLLLVKPQVQHRDHLAGLNRAAGRVGEGSR
jgi:hypothetical protein